MERYFKITLKQADHYFQLMHHVFKPCSLCSLIHRVKDVGGGGGA